MQQQIQQTHHHMMEAIRLAEGGRYSVSPNPLVGAIIVNAENQIIGRGFHQYAGGPHAEIYALQEAQHHHHQTRGATLYVTLEPCAHYGRTPPCTTALIAAGIRKVYVACLDPNPLVSGRGIRLLQEAGIEVEIGLCASAAQKQNEIFFHYITQKKPFVFAKWAMSLDGKTIAHQNDNRHISGQGASFLTHQLRASVDAILIGANTAIQDDPLLTARNSGNGHENANENKNAGKQPLRIVLSSKGNLPCDLKIFSTELPGKTLIATTVPAHHLPIYSKSLDPHSGIEILVLPANSQGRVDLSSLLLELGRREISSVLVEGGMTVNESFIQEKLIQKIFVYVAPVIIGTLEKKQPVEIIQTTQLQNDSIYEVKYV